MASAYPASAAERDKWILDLRPARAQVNPREPYAFFVEEECGASGHPERVAAILLSNRECPFRCTMCDLWRNTLTGSTPLGAIPEQIDFAFERLAPARTVKLYNSGSFFDPRAIPPADYDSIAARVQHFDRVIVECHPAFVGQPCLAFRDALTGRLEVAMGLETANPDVLEKLNKRMTLDAFEAAARFLRGNGIDLRVFILVQPPFMKAEEALHWAQRSLDFAFDCGATAATLIPARGGNGAMEALAAAGEFAPPALNLLEDAVAYGLRLRRGRVFTDLWNAEWRTECASCLDARVKRLQEMNLRQILTGAAICSLCGVHSGGRNESAL